MQMVRSISTPMPVITLYIPLDAFSTTQKAETIRCSLHRLRGCFGNTQHNGSVICVQFDGTQTTEEAVCRLAQRMLTRAQTENLQLTAKTHWELVIEFITDVDSNSRGPVSAKLRALLSEHITLKWISSRGVRVVTPVEPGRNFRQEITAAGFNS